MLAAFPCARNICIHVGGWGVGGGGEAPFQDEMLCHTAVHEQTKLPVKRLGRKWRAKEAHKNKNPICRLTKLWEP